MSDAEARIDYVEITTGDLEASKTFFAALLGWSFTDYGPTYSSFHDGRLAGGFQSGDPAPGSILVVLYLADLEAAVERVRALGGTVSKEIVSFPGGRRFHFRDPGGNEFAVWSDKE
jgi:predicted enzyme related to lactoylglutathione lyase